MKNYHIPTWKGIIIILAAFFLALFVVFSSSERIGEQIVGNSSGMTFPLKEIEQAATSILHLFEHPDPDKIPLSVPVDPEIGRMKIQGCVADGVLNGLGGHEKRMTKLINDSGCYYLHRAVETWLDPPDFDEVRKNIVNIENREKMVLGMFIAEAIDTKSNYHYAAENRDFDFSKMCRNGSKNFWGEHTCKPSLKKSEYRKYIKDITEQAMDLGVQSFMFGQVFYQDDISESIMPEIIKEMKEFAAFRGMKIVIGAQTNDIVDENYLRQFDFIEGGVGLASNGTVENGACFSRWDNWCWALLWHDNYKSKANNVFVHLDWSGRRGDDMSTFALMAEKQRQQTLIKLHEHFTSQDVGFLLPIQAVLPPDNGGCHGPSKKYYTPDEKYSCKDEDAIKDILKNKKKR